jgi:hypothetical protein
VARGLMTYENVLMPSHKPRLTLTQNVDGHGIKAKEPSSCECMLPEQPNGEKGKGKREQPFKSDYRFHHDQAQLTLPPS